MPGSRVGFSLQFSPGILGLFLSVEWVYCDAADPGAVFTGMEANEAILEVWWNWIEMMFGVFALTMLLVVMIGVVSLCFRKTLLPTGRDQLWYSLTALLSYFILVCCFYGVCAVWR